MRRLTKQLTATIILLGSCALILAGAQNTHSDDYLSSIQSALDTYDEGQDGILINDPEVLNVLLDSTVSYEDLANNKISKTQINKMMDRYPTVLDDPYEVQNRELSQTEALMAQIDERLKTEYDPAVENETWEEMPPEEEYVEQEETLSNDIVIDLLELKNMDIMDVLKLVSEKSGVNIIAGLGVQGKVTIYLKNVKLKDALRIILDSNNLAYRYEDGIIRVMPAAEHELRYGHKFGGEVKTKILHLLYADAKDLLPVVDQMRSPYGKILINSKSNTLVLTDTPQKLKTMEQLIDEVDVPVKTEVFELSYAKAEEISQKIERILSANIGHLHFDSRTNKMVVTDTHLKLQDIARVISSFDVQEEEVLIEAKIIQIILSDQHKFGVDWQAIVSDYHQLDLKSDFDILSSSEKRGSLSIGTLSSDDYTVLIEALETVGITNILSSPSITTINNMEAKILVGSTEPYVTTTTTTPASGPTTTAESINFIEVGVKLFVTPTIHLDDFVTMKIRPEVSSVTSTVTTSNNNSIPVVETSEAETTVRVKDGVTIVIGGLIKEEKINTDKKVPLLGDIPVLGNIFKNADHLVKKTEIVIFLTPKIVTGDSPGENKIQRNARLDYP